jgi:hypothetical protein
MQAFEKLGTFYLGKQIETVTGEVSDRLLLYDAKDLTTHAMMVGMTGSGKTGLALALLEEAAIDGIPAILIDPKGDLGNLMLQFPDMKPDDFRPWVDDAEAARNGMSPEVFAAKLPRPGVPDSRSGARTASVSAGCRHRQSLLFTRREAQPDAPCNCCVRSTPRRQHC